MLQKAIMRYPIIGIAGRAGSGKTAIIKELVKERPRYTDLAFANPIKDFLFQCGASEEALFGDSKLRDLPADLCISDYQFKNNCNDLGRKLGLGASHIESLDFMNPDVYYLYQHLLNNKHRNSKIRTLLQFIGNWGRNIDINIWVKYTLDLAKEMLYTGKTDLIIINDVRFINELLAIKELGGTIIRLIKPDEQKLNHQSEVELDSVPHSWYDRTVMNTKDLDWAVFQFKAIIDNL